MSENETTVEKTTETSNEEETNDTAEETAEDQTDYKAEAAKYKAMYERAKKPKEDTKETKVSDNLPTREELIAIAQGTSEEALDQLNAIAKGKGISLKEAKEDPMFKSWQKAEEAKAKSEKAQLGTSSGSKAEEAPNISKMTRAEHEAYARKLLEK